MLLELSIPHVMAPGIRKFDKCMVNHDYDVCWGTGDWIFLGAKIISSQKPKHPIHFIFGINILILPYVYY